MKQSEFIENILKDKGYKLKVKHLHQGNSSKRQRQGHPYITVAWVVDGDHNEIARGKAMCSRKDSPSRKMGRELAVGRALLNLTNGI